MRLSMLLAYLHDMVVSNITISGAVDAHPTMIINSNSSSYVPSHLLCTDTYRILSLILKFSRVRLRVANELNGGRLRRNILGA